MSKKYYPSGYQILNLGNDVESGSYGRDDLPDGDWKLLFDLLKAGKGLKKPFLISAYDMLLRPTCQTMYGFDTLAYLAIDSDTLAITGAITVSVYYVEDDDEITVNYTEI